MVCERLGDEESPYTFRVLILVLMEDGLREVKIQSVAFCAEGLNPCFNGRWSASLPEKDYDNVVYSRLNPCFNGRWSARFPDGNVRKSLCFVLILVLMEDGLRGPHDCYMRLIYISLNPCFNGRWSARRDVIYRCERAGVVLILVLMEDGLRGRHLNGN